MIRIRTTPDLASLAGSDDTVDSATTNGLRSVHTSCEREWRRGLISADVADRRDSNGRKLQQFDKSGRELKCVKSTSCLLASTINVNSSHLDCSRPANTMKAPAPTATPLVISQEELARHDSRVTSSGTWQRPLPHDDCCNYCDTHCVERLPAEQQRRIRAWASDVDASVADRHKRYVQPLQLH